ncbi:MAG: DUF1638 domain-containing protein [Deltaproteobacteria bacterium]|jgi:hypothetical protein|nr:DUF1638 domain-containing protein [Deltaproteobacteria bacterium]
METILVACETIKDEIVHALEEQGLTYEVVWLEGGLHSNPMRLKTRVQEVLNEVEGRCQRLLLALGFCGGGLTGLFTGNYETVIPLTDDCLTLLLGSLKARQEASHPVTYFFTDGWLRHEQNLLTSYKMSYATFDEEMAAYINKTLLEGYSRLGILDTRCYDIDKVVEMVKPMAIDLGLSIEVIQVDPSWLTDFLSGPYDDSARFLRLPPNSTLDLSDWLEKL